MIRTAFSQDDNSFPLVALRSWFLEHKRSFPWRESPTPYRVWVSEVMLQQTRAEVVIPYFLKWMERDFNISLYIVRQLAEKLINTGIKMRSAVSYPLKYQVLLYIWKYVSQYKNNCIPKVLIVEELGSNIRSINRILKQLAEEGIIINLSGKIKIEDLNLVLTMMSQYELC